MSQYNEDYDSHVDAEVKAFLNDACDASDDVQEVDQEPEHLDDNTDPVQADHEWLVSAGYGDDEDYGYASEVL